MNQTLKNPRHDDQNNELAAIKVLLKDEQVYKLASDIVSHGLNPLERLGVIKISGTGENDQEASYTAVEGNRRLCALKLLVDPELAPTNKQSQFKKLSKKWSAPNTIPCVLFSSRIAARPWLERIHNGPQEGIGRKSWDAEQKQRFSGGNKNKLAQAVLDHAQNANLISADRRKAILTTVQRFLANPTFRNTLGVDLKLQANDKITLLRPEAEFNVLLKTFLNELITGEIEKLLGKLPSRTKAADIVTYAMNLAQTPLDEATQENPNENEDVVEDENTEPEDLDNDENDGDGDESEEPDDDPPTPPTKPQKPTRIAHSNAIRDKLTSLDNYKLSSLYYSICAIQLKDHTAIASVGVWSFFECLTAAMGRNSTTSFGDFLNRGRMSQLGVGSGKALNAFDEAIQRLHRYGNTTKHSDTAGYFDSEQLVNDMATLKTLLLACIEDAINNQD